MQLPGTYRLAMDNESFDMNRDGSTDPELPTLELKEGQDASGLILYARVGTAPEVVIPTEETDPAVAVDQAGVTHLLFVREAAIWHAFYQNGHWSSAQLVSSTAGSSLSLEASPSLFGPGEPGLIAVWTQGGNNESDAYYAAARSDSNGGYDWSAPQALQRDALEDSLPALVLTATGDPLIVFRKQDAAAQDDTDLYYERLDLKSGNLTWPAGTQETPTLSLMPSSDAEWGSADCKKIVAKFDASDSDILDGKLKVGISAEQEHCVSDCKFTTKSQIAATLDLSEISAWLPSFEGSGSYKALWKPLPEDCCKPDDPPCKNDSQIDKPHDPNDLLGPPGFGEERWVSAQSTLPYTIRFENMPGATAAAHQVVIYQQLDPDLDPRTFRLGDLGWGNLRFDMPENLAFINRRFDFTATKGYYVDVTAGVDVLAGEVFWTLSSARAPATSARSVSISTQAQSPHRSLAAIATPSRTTRT